jgi:hypothetical protein
MVVVVVLFWFVGVATGIVSAIFLLDLEDAYIFQPTRYFISEIQTRFAKVVSGVRVSLKRAFQAPATHRTKIIRVRAVTR